MNRILGACLCLLLLGCTVEETPAPPAPAPDGTTTSKAETTVPATPHTPGPEPVAPAQAPAPTLADVGETYQLAFSQDGSTLASYGDDGCVHVWDVKTGRHRVMIGALSVVGCQPNADGTRVTLLISSNMAIRERRVVDAATGKDVASIKLDIMDPAPRVCVFSPDGARLIAEGYGGCDIYAVEGEQPVLKVKGVAQRSYLNFAWSPDGRRVAAAEERVPGQDCSIMVWDAQSGAVEAQISSEGSIGRLAFAPDGNTLYAADFDGLAAFALPAGERTKVEQAPVSSIGSYELSPDGRHLLVFFNSHGEWKVSLYGFADGKPLRQLDKPTSWAFHPDGERLAVAVGGKIVFQKVETGEDVTPAK